MILEQNLTEVTYHTKRRISTSKRKPLKYFFVEDDGLEGRWIEAYSERDAAIQYMNASCYFYEGDEYIDLCVYRFPSDISFQEVEDDKVFYDSDWRSEYRQGYPSVFRMLNPEYGKNPARSLWNI